MCRRLNSSAVTDIRMSAGNGSRRIDRAVATRFSPTPLPCYLAPTDATSRFDCPAIAPVPKSQCSMAFIYFFFF
jgi:hypothetical protein